MEPRKSKPNLRSYEEFALNSTKPQTTTTNALNLLDNLKSAFANMTVDVVEQFGKSIAVLEDPDSTVLKILAAVNDIRDHIDGIEMANNFVKAGGAIILKYFESKNPQIFLNVTYLISEIAQNNRFCQEYFIKSNIMPKLLENLKSGTDDIGAAAIHAITTLARNYSPGRLAFVRCDGVQSILNSIIHDSPKLIKASFLIAKLSMESEEVRDEFVTKSAIEHLSKFFDVVQGYDVKIENLLFAISILVKSTIWQPNDRLKCGLDRQLNEFIDTNKNLAQSEDMVEYAEQILQSLRGYANSFNHEAEQ